MQKKLAMLLEQADGANMLTQMAKCATTTKNTSTATTRDIHEHVGDEYVTHKRSVRHDRLHLLQIIVKLPALFPCPLYHL